MSALMRATAGEDSYRGREAPRRAWVRAQNGLQAREWRGGCGVSRALHIGGRATLSNKCQPVRRDYSIAQPAVMMVSS